MRAPLRVPVELRRGERWFRLAHEVGPTGLGLTSALPEELEGPLEVSFHLPKDPRPIACHGRAEEERIGEGETERAELRQVRFADLDDEAKGRIEAYVKERLGIL